MSAYRKTPTFIHPALSITLGEVILSDEECHHAYHVRRLSAGQACHVINAEGIKADGILHDGGRVIFDHVYESFRPFGNISWVIPVLALPQLKEVIQTSVFLGIHTVYIVPLKFSQPIKNKGWIEKLQSICLHSQKVASLPFQPKIELIDLETVLIKHQQNSIVFHQGATQDISQLRKSERATQMPVLVFGPEGGLSCDEQTFFSDLKIPAYSVAGVNIPSRLAPGLLTSLFVGFTH